MNVSPLDRIKWRIEQGHWIANKIDIDAINLLIDFVRNKNHDTINKNKIAYSLYVSCFSICLKLQGLSFLHKNSQKEFHKSLDRSLELIISEISRDLNNMEQLSFFDELQIDLTHPAIKESSEKKKNDNSKIDSAIKIPHRFNQCFGCAWEYKEVEKNLKNQFLAFLEATNK